MSKRFLTKVAGGVALGSAALLLGAPAAAFAEPAEADAAKPDTVEEQTLGKGAKGDKEHGKKGEKEHGKKLSKEDFKHRVKDKHGKVFACAVAKQKADADAKSIIGDVKVSKSKETIIAIIPIVPARAASVNNSGLVICVPEHDLVRPLELELDGLDPVVSDVDESDASFELSSIEDLARGLYVGKDGVLLGGLGSDLPAGAVAAGDGGALAGGHQGALAAAGAGMLGVAALGGLALRRRSANGTVA